MPDISLQKTSGSSKKETRPADFDIMPGIKDKEKSALEALALARDDPRLVTKKILRMRDLINIPHTHFRHRWIS